MPELSTDLMTLKKLLKLLKLLFRIIPSLEKLNEITYKEIGIMRNKY